MFRTFQTLARLGLLVVILGLTAAACGSDATPESSAAPLELSLGESNALASCLAFDVDTLAGMSPAFSGTVIAVDGETVTLSVDKWYAGGDASTVVLSAPAGLEALIGGIEFRTGERYNITAAQGIVNYCGYSGPATPDFTAAFDEAFAD